MSRLIACNGRALSLFELLGAFGAADFDHLAPEPHFDRIGVELTVASRTGLLVHKRPPTVTADPASVKSEHAGKDDAVRFFSYRQRQALGQFWDSQIVTLRDIK
jgi:hypothetical protein